MSSIDTSLTPSPNPDVDPQSIDATPSAEEFFILSRLDGSTTIDQICKTSGLGEAKTLQYIKNLIDYGLIELPGQDDAGDGASSRDEPPPAANSTPSGLGQKVVARFDQDYQSAPLDRETLDQQVELEPTFKREVLFVHTYLDTLDHYELLGVERDVERRGLRRAYFPMSKRYHPDRFYQKITGDYEALIRQIFERITNAYQTLSDRNKRAAYDKALQTSPSSTASDLDVRASTPASRRSEPREEMASANKKKMARRVLLQRARRAFDEQSFSSAVREFRKALSIEPDADLAFDVAEQFFAVQRFDDAAIFARVARKIDDTQAATLDLMARIYEAKGAPEDALYYLEQAQKLDPSNDTFTAKIEQLKASNTL